jgi:hypothetical protein
MVHAAIPLIETVSLTGFSQKYAETAYEFLTMAQILEISVAGHGPRASKIIT